jgi:hypothetical protein
VERLSRNDALEGANSVKGLILGSALGACLWALAGAVLLLLV